MQTKSMESQTIPSLSRTYYNYWSFEQELCIAVKKEVEENVDKVIHLLSIRHLRLFLRIKYLHNRNFKAIAIKESMPKVTVIEVENEQKFVMETIDSTLCNLSDDEEDATPDADAEVIDTEAESKSGNWIETLDQTKCGKRHSGCCEQMYIGDEDTLVKCFTLHQSNLPPENEKDPAKLAKFLSCFVECIYKQKKYIGKGDNINMKMVKADAEKMYADRPKEKEYHIKMYEFCRKDALKLYGLVKMNPAGAVMLRDSCKPFFLFVFLCQAEYPKKHSCPYFMWEGKPKTELVEQCKDGKGKCYEIDGIHL